MKITLQKNGIQKRITAGFSVTMLFLGWFVPLARGMMLPALLGACTFKLASLYYMFVINRLYAEKLISEGWSVVDSEKENGAEVLGVSMIENRDVVAILKDHGYSHQKVIEWINKRQQADLRDMFAAKAMQAEISRATYGIEDAPRDIAECAYEYADAMLAERNKP